VSDNAAFANLQGYYRWHAHLYDATRWSFGTGRNLAELARAFPYAEIVGLDLSAEMLAKAQKKIAPYARRVSLRECAYNTPVSGGDPFDLIVLSYCLSMINPGYADVLRLCERDLSPQGRLAVVDFHDTKSAWFRSWMGMNHVRMDGQILAALHAAGLNVQPCVVSPAYGGVWRWFGCFAFR
jgi:S-adenosylmethionine-diacylgycerolhomoserine-N-methlytransferase